MKTLIFEIYFLIISVTKNQKAEFIDISKKI